MRKEIQIGLILFAMPLLLKQFIEVPEIMMGFLLGLAICFELIGALPESVYQKIKCWKRSLLNRA